MSIKLPSQRARNWIAVLFVICWIIQIVTIPRVGSIFSFERVWATARTTDQAVLGRMALQDTSQTVRLAAIDMLTDQAALAKVAIEGNDSKVQMAAVAKLTENSALAKVAIEGRPDESSIIEAAILKGYFAPVAADAAKKGSPRDPDIAWLQSFFDVQVVEVRLKAIENLADQSVLTKLALEDKSFLVRAAAVRNITDQVVLARIALEDKMFLVRFAAADSRLANQMVLAKVAVGDGNPDVRTAAVRKLTDQVTLKEVIASDKDLNVRTAAQACLDSLNGK